MPLCSFGLNGIFEVLPKTLLIRASKFHNSRLLPLANDLAKEVDGHLLARRRAYASALATEPLLWNPGRERAVFCGEPRRRLSAAAMFAEAT
jgi:hypothetical protein